MVENTITTSKDAQWSRNRKKDCEKSRHFSSPKRYRNHQMCGILSLITVHHDDNDDEAPSPVIPGCIPVSEIENQIVEGQQFHSWQSLNSDAFLDQDWSQNVKQLSKSDRKKLDNLDNLRQLTLQLNRLNNRINKQKKTVVKPKKKKKNHDDENEDGEQQHTDSVDIEEQIRLVKVQINGIIGQDEDDSRSIPTSSCPSTPSLESLIYKVSSRGPDYINYTQFATAHPRPTTFQLFSSILSLRQPFTTQPIISHDHHFILQFNGELYNDECLLYNDTQFIMNKLAQSPSHARRDDVLKTVNELKGEFAFILYDLLNSVVYFGRDRIGKRSLVYAWNQPQCQLLISSVPDPVSGYDQFVECENKIYEFDLNAKQLRTHDYLHHAQAYAPLKYRRDTADEHGEGQVVKVYHALKASTWKRQLTINPLHHEEIEGTKPSLAILFSGGLDCTIIASLICENMMDHKLTNKTIDLLTVGFDNPRIDQLASSSPDRMLAKKSWFYLQQKYRDVTIRLIEINVSYKHWLTHKQRVLDLIYPSNTEMDLSIGIAFYFASGCNSDLTTKLQFKSVSDIPVDLDYDEFMKVESDYIDYESNYKSSAKVLFSGLGADELFAGYSRHEAIFQNITDNDELPHLYDTLSSELIHDIEIIHNRNLGRDDRVIGCWGKELRYPYLDEEFISLVINEIEPSLKLYIEHNHVGSGKRKLIRKYLLRKLANDQLGLPWIKDELKRAIQFGAKSAKLEIGQNKIKGTDVL